MSQFIRQLTRQRFFQDELTFQPGLKAAFEQNLAYTWLENESVGACLTLLPRSARLEFDFQRPAADVPDYLFAYLGFLLAAWPEPLSPDFFGAYLKLVLHRSAEQHHARFKNYFIHQLDGLLQSELGLGKPQMGKFRSKDRRFFESQRGAGPLLRPTWHLLRIDAHKPFELALLAWKLYFSGKAHYPITTLLEQAGRLWQQPGQPVLWPQVLLQRHLQMAEYRRQFQAAPSALHFLQALLEQFLLQLDTLPEWMRQVQVWCEAGLRSQYETVFTQLFRSLTELAQTEIGEHVFANRHRSALKAWLQTWERLPLRFADMLQQPEVRLNALMLELELMTQPIRDFCHQLNSLEAPAPSKTQASAVNIQLDKYFIDSHGKACASPDWGAFFLTPQEVVEIESRSQEVWVITPHFLFDTQTIHDYFNEVVTDNMVQGKIHRYFHTADTRFLAQSLVRKYATRSEQIFFYEAPQLEPLFAAFQHEIVIYDPLQPVSVHHCGFYLDILGALAAFQSKQSLPVVHLKISERHLLHLISFLNQLVEAKG